LIIAELKSLEEAKQQKRTDGKTGTEKRWVVIVEGRKIQPESCAIAEDHQQAKDGFRKWKRRTKVLTDYS